MLRILFIFCCCWGSSGLFAQSTDSLLVQLERQLQAGKISALRDVATLLEQPTLAARARQLLQHYTLLNTSEWNWTITNQEQTRFLELYYTNRNNWRFSPLLDAFYLTPLEFQSTKYVIKTGQNTKESGQLRFLVRDFRAAMLREDKQEIHRLLPQISHLQSEEANRFLLSLFEENLFRSPKSRYYLSLMNELVKLPYADNVQTILAHLQQKKLSRIKAIALLSQLTNVQIVENTNQLLSTRYQHLLDSLGGMEQLRQYGYDQIYKLRPSFFEHQVDYYGMVLSYAEPFPWIIKNAIRDVLKTEHPRALFYVAAQLFQFRNRPNWVFSIGDLQDVLERQTGLQVAVQDRDGRLRFDIDLLKDTTALKNYITYWAGHYEDYEWDMLRQQFVNKNQAIAQTEVYESLFRRLNSSNDSVALDSYIKLTEGDPIEVLGLAKKYKDLLRNYNKTLPSFKYQYLEQLVQLTHFCKQNDYEYDANYEVRTLFQQLQTALSPAERHQLENELSDKISLPQITALEYEAIIGVNVRPFTFSAGRVLKRFYARAWTTIISDEEQLRLYLKKAQLFKNMGTIGTCNTYFDAFEDISDELRKRLQQMYDVETDIDVLQGIKKLLTEEDPQQQLDVFFDDPLSISREELNNLPPLPSAHYNTIIDVLLDSETEDVEQQVLRYISKHLSIELVPYLMQILVQDIQPKQVSKFLNKIYGLRRDANEWLLLWQTDGGNFEQWSLIFFEEQLTHLRSARRLSIKDINSVTRSVHYDTTYKLLVLEGLAKLTSATQVRRLKIQPKLNLNTDLAYLENFDFSYKELDDLGRLFEIDRPALLLDFMARKASSFDPDEKGAFYNSLFRNDWFTNYVNQDQLTQTQSDYIQRTLQTYLNESELISEFEEQATIRNIAALSNRGKGLQERLQASIRLDAGAGSVTEIQQAIIARISYDEIPVVMEMCDQLTAVATYPFLNQDFGLPIFDLTDVPTQREIIRHHQQWSPLAFYRHYLTTFGVDFLSNKGKLDYEKIYDILSFDIVTPFVGGGGNTRDYYTYGIIKLLEFTFDTTLGYHPKLNENQQFYSYSAAKRAADWQAFLVKNKWVDR